jgi:hypothetical protein
MSEKMPLTLTLRTARSVAAISLLCLLLGVLVLTQPAAAQVLYGSLTGTVTDPSGASLPNAAIEVLNTGTGTARSLVTDSNGSFLITNLLPGTYTVSVSASGFAKYRQESITLLANQQRRVDVAMTLAQSSQQVEVSASAVALQADRTDVNTQLDAAQLANLPMIGSAGRNFQALYKFVPGMSMVTEGISSDGGNPQRTMTGNVNGNSFQGNVVKIDGVSNSYIWLPFNSAFVPPTEGIESVSIVTNSADAEQGNVAGAAVNVITKSGTNTLHGSAFEDHTDKSLKAQNLFQTVGTKKPQYIFNQYGASVGGPIRKNKIFFFGDWEGIKRRQAAAPVKSVINPTAIFDGSGNANLASGITNTTTCAGCVYDPNTGTATGTLRTVFPGNIIPANRIDPVAKTILGRINGGTFLNSVGAGATNNYLGGGSTQMNRNTGDAKVSWVPSDKTTLFGRYSISQANLVDPPLLGLAMGGSSGGGQVGTAPSRIQNVGAGGTYTISPTLLVDANAGFTRQRLGATYAPDLNLGNYGQTGLHIPGTNGSSYLEQGTPAFIVTGWNSMGNSDTGNPFLFRDNQWLGNVNLGWMKGSHSLRFGFENGRDGMNHFQPQGGSFQTPRGSFRFIGNVTALNKTGAAASTPTNSMAQFLLGLPDEVGRADQVANPNSLRWQTYSFYARDAWQLSSRLTITYGVRWEFYPMATADHGGVKLFNLSTNQVLIGGYGSTPMDDGVNVGHGQFLPRVGIAYRLGDKMVIRAGYAMNADNNNWRFFRNNYPATINSDVTPSVGGGSWAPAASLSGETLGAFPGLTAGIPVVAVPDISSGAIPLPSNVNPGNVVPFNFRRGYIHSYNLTLQREFSSFVAEAGYVGTRGIRLLTNENLNASYPGAGNNGRWLFPTIHNGNDVNCLCPDANSYYDSLQAKLTWRSKSGNQIGAVYTFSKAINWDDNEEAGGNYGGFITTGNLLWPYPGIRSRNKALAGYDRPQNLQVYGIYALPFGKNQKFATSGLLAKVAGGWQVNWVLSTYSGPPLTLAYGGSISSPGNQQTADQVGPVTFPGNAGATAGNGTTCAPTNLDCHYFDPSAFKQVPTTQIRYGTSGRNILRGPGFFNLDTSLFRDFNISERIKLQIRAEMIGTTNTPHLGAPGLDVSNTGTFGVITQTLNTAGRGASTGGERQTWLSAHITF